MLADCKQVLNSRVNLLLYIFTVLILPLYLVWSMNTGISWWRKGDRRAWEGTRVLSDFLGHSMCWAAPTQIPYHMHLCLSQEAGAFLHAAEHYPGQW